MDKNGKAIVAIVLVAIIGYMFVAQPTIQIGNYVWNAKPSGGAVVTDPCAAYPGTSWDQATGSCKASSAIVQPSGVYNGPATWTVTSRDGDTKAAITLTNVVYWLMKPDGTYAGTPVQATATTISIEPSYNGKLTLVIKYMDSTVGFVDAAKTVAQNPSYMKSAMYLKDVDTNGQLDQCYDLDIGWVSIKAGQTAAVIIIDLIAWNADTSATISSVSVPTGMHTAGDYHATGYISTITETYMWTVQKINLKSNTTASTKFGVKFAAGTTYIVAFKMQGIGAQTHAQYGQNWLKQDFYSPNYDAAQDEWAVYRAHNPVTGAVDVSQVNYGMPFVNERQSGTTWLMYDIWVHTTGDIAASATEILEVEIWCTDPAGSQTEATTNLTFTG